MITRQRERGVQAGCGKAAVGGAGIVAIWRTRDRWGREVELTEAGLAHILENRDTEMRGREADVRAAVERPELVTRDASDPRRECHYRGRGPSGHKLKVVVGYEPVPHPGT